MTLIVSERKIFQYRSQTLIDFDKLLVLNLKIFMSAEQSTFTVCSNKNFNLFLRFDG